MSSLENVLQLWSPELTHHCPKARRILVGLKSDRNYMRYDHDKLVFGYVHQLDFYHDINVLEDIISIILQYELGNFESYEHDSSVIFPTPQQIEETRVQCNCDGYMEVSAKEKDNIEELVTMIAKSSQRAVVDRNRRPTGRCILL